MLGFEYVLIGSLFSIALAVSLTIPKFDKFSYFPTFLSLISVIITGAFFVLATISVLLN